jgi:asparagine synthase (glutamine-hydrolysing)
MCGIAGILDQTDQSHVVNASRLMAMSAAIAHRGPDGEGYIFIDRRSNANLQLSGPDSPESIRASLPDISERILADGYDLALAHRRFSIIDLSPAGHQPFVDTQNQVCVILNGEIYNYVEIRQELIEAGREFRTATDTEVLAQSYLEWGESCFERLNGMWAVALYDLRQRQLILCRDRLGKRPLYYFSDNGRLVFASEIKSLLQCDFVRAYVEVNVEAVSPFILQGWRDLENQTFFTHIHSLPPGSFMRIDYQCEPSFHTYWSIPRISRSLVSANSISDAATDLRTLLSDSIRIRMRADVPVAFELSGGLDSSSLVGLASHLTDRPISAYTVSFDSPEWDESVYAKSVAVALNVKHRLIQPPALGFWDEVNNFIYQEEEPFHSPNLHTNFHLRRLIAADGFRVVVTGGAGDEIFAGYPDYLYAYLADLSSNGHWPQYLRNLLGRSDLRSPRKLMSILRHPLHSARRILASNDWFSWLKEQSTPLESILVNLPIPSIVDLPMTVQDLLYENMTRYKLPYWLRSSDKTNMAIPIEPRSPFLDYRVVEFAFRLPIDLLIRNGWLKWILRTAMGDLLPANVIWRKSKMGFPFPMHDWLAQSRDTIRAIFASMDNPFIDRRVIMDSLEKFEISSPYALWRLLSFELWHRRFMRQEEVRVAPGTHSLS